MKRWKVVLLCVLCVVFAIVGCGKKATPTPETRIETRIVKETVVVQVTPVPTDTPVETPTGVQTATSTSTSTVTPTPTPNEVQVLSTAVAKLSAQVAGQVQEPITATVVMVSESSFVTPTVVTGTLVGASGEFSQGWSTEWYRSSFTGTTNLTVTGTIETFAEPGVLLDATAAFDHLSALETPILAPEGGFSFIAVGAISLSHNGGQLKLYHQERNIYLVIIRGLPEDGTVADLNQVVMATDYVRSAGIYSPMPVGSYVSLGWFVQQIQSSYRGPDCGGQGCAKVTIVVVDLQTHTFRLWLQSGTNFRDWKPVY